MQGNNMSFAAIPRFFNQRDLTFAEDIRSSIDCDLFTSGVYEGITVRSLLGPFCRKKGSWPID